MPNGVGRAIGRVGTAPTAERPRASERDTGVVRSGFVYRAGLPFRPTAAAVRPRGA